MQELMARIEALLRRAPIRTGQVVHQFGPIRIETRGMMDHRDVKVTRAGVPIYLSAREFELLRYFVEHPGMVLSREELLRAVWGYEAGTFTRTVDVHVASLRQKIEKDPKRPELIVTVHKSGYRFVGGGEY
jgi:two-component system, OmpR family, alkaline phosphatase synthesis response regulator PhoP